MKMTKITFITFVLLIALTACSSDNNEVSTVVDCSSSVEGLSSYSEILPLPTEYYYDADYDECDDIDLSVQATCYTSEGNCIYITRDEYGNISGHDLNENYISGYSDQYGNTTIHDMNGNYSYSYTDDYGNTSGHDMNGNYYSAYTDDFGYTTITSY